MGEEAGSGLRKWAEEEFGGAMMSDWRMQERVILIGEAMASQPGVGIGEMFGRVADVRAAYRFLEHKEATPENLRHGHQEGVELRMREAGVYLMLEDTTEVECNGGGGIEGLGPIGGSRTAGRGFLLHTTLVVKWEENRERARRPGVEIIGIVAQQYRVRELQPVETKGKGSRRRSGGSEVESELWEEGVAAVGSAPSGVRWVKITDRGGDIYDHLKACQEAGFGYVIRAKSDRVELDSEGVKTGAKLFETVRGSVSLGQMGLKLRSRPTQPARTAILDVSVTTLRLRSPAAAGFSPGKRPPLEVTVVRAWEATPPANVTPLEWVLLTDHPVTTLDQVIEVVRMYATRWLEEEFHKALKTGMGLEQHQLKSAAAWFALTAMMSIAALRLISLREVGLTSPLEPPSASGLTSLELDVLAARTASSLTSVRQVLLALARLGGHLNRSSDGPPGWIVLWRGYLRLQYIIEGVQIARKLTSYG